MYILQGDVASEPQNWGGFEQKREEAKVKESLEASTTFY